ncbi:hypothetical protein EDE11_13914 [Methylomonas methanica]|uniref:Uncharacterized protein n=1 Tax=Methylomonas methanica TaxID=421 RepID=A0ABY2CFM9_METMH|nr:hypothetical protein EDE11_13914 [Methylomonas methanica]
MQRCSEMLFLSKMPEPLPTNSTIRITMACLYWGITKRDVKVNTQMPRPFLPISGMDRLIRRVFCLIALYCERCELEPSAIEQALIA